MILIEEFNNKKYHFLGSDVEEAILSHPQLSFVIEKDKEKVDLFIMKNEEVVGHSYFYEDKNFMDIGYIEVHEDFQRQGLASLMFKIIERLFNKKLENHDLVTDEGDAFWRNYNKNVTKQ